jgi:acetolactate synthase-1/2/3 large subunit
VATVADCVVKAFEDAGLGLAVGLDDPPSLFASLRRSDIRTVIVHDERSGAFMADGFARASGKPALCAGVSGPGATNLVTGLLEAFCSSSPVLAFVAEARGERVGRPAFQEAAHERLFEPVTKGVVRVERPQDSTAAVHQAIALSASGCPRPVALLTTIGVLGADDGSSAGMPELQAAGNGHRTRILAPPATIAAAVEALRKAERPVILAGNGVHISGATRQLLAVAERYRVPVATSLHGKGAIAETSRLALGVASSYTGGRGGSGVVANRVLREADVVLVVGSDLDPVTTCDGAWPTAQATLIRIDIDQRELLPYDGLRICGDARESLRQLVDVDGEVPRSDSYLAWLEQVCGEAAAGHAESRERDLRRREDAGLWPGALVQELGRCLGQGDAVVTDASYSSAWALDRIRQGWAGRHVFAPRGSGVLGWGLPAALGVKLARPDRSVVCLTGDGGLLFSLGELETAVREGIDVTLVLLNNSSYGFQRHADQLRQGVDHADLAIRGLQWAEIGRAFGWQSSRVTTLADYTRALEQALEAKGPSFIEVIVDKEARPPITMFDEVAQGVAGH